MSSTTQTVGMTTKVSKYFRGVWAELKKVSWPNRTQLLTYTGVVFVTIAIVGVIIWLMDSVFSTLLDFVI